MPKSQGVLLEKHVAGAYQTIVVASGGVLVAKETKDGSRTKPREVEVGQEPGLRIGYISLSHET